MPSWAPLGSLVNVRTKGGANLVHRSAWSWLRQSALDTPTIFQNRSGQKLPIYQDTCYGLSGGSPIYIRKFGDPNVGAITSTVPRLAWRNATLGTITAQEPPRSFQFALNLAF
jgi:hypothetical protein